MHLQIQLRMMHVPGVARMVVLQESFHHTWVAIEMSEHASEEDARDWSQLFAKRYRVETTIDELLSTPQQWQEIYTGGGVGAFINSYETHLEMKEQRRQIEKKYGYRLN